MAVSSGEHQEKDGFSDINVTPLTDVLLVLLIIFLITGSSITAPSHAITLPEVVTKEKVENVNVVVDVTPDGQWFVGNRECKRDELQPFLHSMALKKKTDQVIINGDSLVPYKYVLIAVNASRMAGLTNVALATEHKATVKKGELVPAKENEQMNKTAKKADKAGKE